MSYGLKYQTQFTSVSDPIAGEPSKLFTLQFLFKGYSGNAVTLDGGDVTVRHKCTLDDPFAPIKGQSLDITLVNKGSTPIASFQSEEDDGVQVKLMDESNSILFIGYLVQDDFYETMVDFSHYITLSANDSLGLLKDVTLENAEVRRAFYATNYRTNGVDTVVYLRITNSAFYPQSGNVIELAGNSYVIDTAVQEDTIISPLADPYTWTVTLTTSTGGISPTVGTVYLTGEINLLNRNTLLSVIAVCLAQTNLALVTNIFHNLYEYTQDNTISTFDQTLIDTQTFIQGDTYEDCYSVLEKILTAFKCTLVQAYGQWNIVHFFEAKDGLAIPGFVYDETWEAIGTATLPGIFYIGPDPQLTRPIYELTSGAVRGYKFSKKTFNYQQPKYLLRNNDLLLLGDLIRTYTSGTDTISEYVATNWQTGVGPTLCERFIRVAVDNVGNEIYRHLVARGASSNATLAVASDYVEISEGDKIKFSCTFKTNISQGGYIEIIFGIRLIDATLTRYVNEVPTGNGEWINTVGFNYAIQTGDNTDQWQNVEIESQQAPFSGLLTCFLPQAVEPPYNDTRETVFKDIQLEVIPFVNDSSNIIAQVHKDQVSENKKNKNDLEIYVDDSPRNSIQGTLFRNTMAGLLQARTTLWRYPADSNGWRLGERAVLDEMTWKQKTRSKLEGSFVGMYQGSFVSPLNMVRTTFDTNKVYVWGLTDIDYKNNRVSGSLWELFNDNDGLYIPDYSFTYLYEK